MATYVILFGLIMLIGYPISQKPTKRNKNSCTGLLFVLIALLVVMAGLRGVGADYGNYVKLYGNLKKQTLQSLWQATIEFNEPGFKLLCLFASVIYDDPITMFFLSALISIAPCIILIYKEEVPFVIAIILYYLLVWNGTFGAVRQYLAATMIFCAYPFLRERKFWKYCLLIIIGSSFHITALIMLPVYFFVIKKASWKNAIIIILASFILSYSYDYIFKVLSVVKEKEFGEYSYFTTSVNIFRILVAFAPIVLFAFVSKNKQGFLPNEQRSLDLAINIILINAAFMFATKDSAYLARVGIYTGVFFPLAIPEITKRFDKNTRMIIELIMVIFYLAYFLYGIYAQKLGYMFFFQR